ncbi:MAG TPA: ribonuclease HII [Anaerolineaceae bacterium]|nr:ribonuclease HII [Anaerolineaceae bacterium]
MNAKVKNPCLPNMDYESALWQEGNTLVAGLDEAGRGAWAGPVYAAAVILPNDQHVKQILHGVNDSKKLSAKQRERWKDCIQSVSIAWAVASASPQEVDEMGIVPATCTAMTRALDQLHYQPTYLLIDYIKLPNCELPQTSLPKGDAISLSIAAASILAKTARDEYMVAISEIYPQYGFARHKGYGTALHRSMLQTHGICPIHRMSFAPMKFMEH